MDPVQPAQPVVPLPQTAPPVAPPAVPPVASPIVPPTPSPAPTIVPPIVPPPPKKSAAPAIIVLICLLLLAGGAYYEFFVTKTPVPFLHNQVACTLEAKICPDGTSVGRTGPNCEFAPCPEVSQAPTAVPTMPTQPTSGAVTPKGLMKQVTYQGDGASIAATEYGTYVVFKTCDPKIAQCTYYLLAKSAVASYPALTNIQLGDTVMLAGDTKSRGAATGNIFLELVSNITVAKL